MTNSIRTSKRSKQLGVPGKICQRRILCICQPWELYCQLITIGMESLKQKAPKRPL